MSQKVIYASAARTATPTAVDINTGRVKALRLILDVTAVTATPDLVVKVDAVDSLSGKVTNLLTSASVATVSTAMYDVGPGLTAAANLVANRYLGDVVRISVTHGDADSATYTLSAHLIR